MDKYVCVHRLFLPASIVLGMMLLVSAASAQQKFDFKNHPFFKQLIGEWTMEGELKSAEGEVLKFKREEKAEVTGEDIFTIEGKREMNKVITHYKWTITRKDTGVFEAVFQPRLNKVDATRYEARVMEDGSRAEFEALGPSKEKMVFVETFKDGDHDTLEVKDTMMDRSGAVVISGTNFFKRVKKP